MQADFIYDCASRLVHSCVLTTSGSTGKERDTESGNDYFLARYYNSATGRFLSPDWSAKTEPVPYAKLENPQSLNLYSYVYNNPLLRADPDGHCPAWMQGICDKANSAKQKVEAKATQIKNDAVEVAKSSDLTLEIGFGLKGEASNKTKVIDGHAGISLHDEYEFSKNGEKTTIKAEGDVGGSVIGFGGGGEAGVKVDTENTKVRGYAEPEAEVAGEKSKVAGKADPDQISIGGSAYDVVGGGAHVSVSITP